MDRTLRNIFIFTILTTSINGALLDWTEVQKSAKVASPVWFSENDLTVLVDKSKKFDLIVDSTLDQSYSLSWDVQHDGLVRLEPPTLQISVEPSAYNISIFGVSPGSLLVSGKLTPNTSISDANLFIRVKVAMSNFIIHFSNVIGWVYFAAWSISFYPQIWINFKRKSVVGLSFDFLALNLLGHTLYAIFNIGLYWIPEVQDQYFDRHPRGLNPVLLNDVFFSIHASLITLVTVTQCFIYERGQQRVSYTAQGIMGIFVVVIIVTGGLTVGEHMIWLDFLYTLSYIKLAITLMKYVPQAVLNYRRKSTAGWSIGNILLDFTGGTLSMLQMILNAYNYDDWVSIFGDPTKFGLGLFSVAFDVLFIIQHYVLYRNSNSSKDVPKVSVSVKNEVVEEVKSVA